MLFLGLCVVFAAAKDAQIQRHAVIDHEARSKLMRQESTIKNAVADRTNDKAASNMPHRDEKISEIEDLLQESDAEKRESEKFLKESSDSIVKEEDKNIFKAADEDHSGHLDPNEMNKVLTKAGLSETDFDWHSHDADKDGQLSQDEFLAAGQAAGQRSKPRTLSLLENHIWKNGGSSKLMKLQDFKTYDSDASGNLEAGEASQLMKGVGLGEDTWRKFDVDGDGKLSEEEFDRDLEKINKDTMASNQGANPDHAIFKGADSDGSSFLEESEVDSLLNSIPALHHSTFDWRAFDQDGDDRLSETEFIRAGPAVLHAVRAADHGTSPASFVEFTEEDDEDEEDEADSHEDGEEQDDEDHDEEDEEEHKVDDDDVKSHVAEDFKLADKNHDGLLDEHEMEDFAEEAGFPDHFNWKQADINGDGKLTEEELFNLARRSHQGEKMEHPPDDEEVMLKHKHMQ